MVDLLHTKSIKELKELDGSRKAKFFQTFRQFARSDMKFEPTPCLMFLHFPTQYISKMDGRMRLGTDVRAQGVIDELVVVDKIVA